MILGDLIPQLLQPMPHIPSTPVTPLHPHLFDYYHIQNGYAYAGPPSSPIYASPPSSHAYTGRPTLMQFEYPQAPQQPAGMVQPLQLPIQLASPIHHRLSSHPANEYLQQQGTYMTEEPTPKTRCVYSYHPGFLSPFSPAMSTPALPSPAPYMPPALAQPSCVSANPYTPQPWLGPYVWYGIFSAYTLMISGMVMPEVGMKETKAGCTMAWVIGAAVGGRGKR